MRKSEETTDPVPSKDDPVVCLFDDPREAPPGDPERAEDAFDIPLGAVVTAAETGGEWVFFGWSSNTAGTYPNFIEAVTPARFPGVPFYDYHAAFAATLERKFPDVARFRRTPKTD